MAGRGRSALSTWLGGSINLPYSCVPEIMYVRANVQSEITSMRIYVLV